MTAHATFTDPWCWPLDVDSWPLLATYVLPHDGVVTRLGGELQRGARRPALSALFRLLSEHSELSYSRPEVIRTRSGTALQVLRAPWRIFPDLSLARGSATCLDLSLLAAGVLESAGEMPLILSALDPDGLPIHAMVAVWRDPGRRFRPILRTDPLRELLRSGAIEALDLIPICRDRAAAYERAKDETQEWIERAPGLLAVDVKALRPPYGAIPPFEAAMESIALAAIADAERIARSQGASRIETAHLLAALWTEGGGVADDLRTHAGRGLDDELRRPRTISSEPPLTTAPLRTRGFQRCIAESRELARAAGSTIVRDVDLWWAVLGGRSASVDRIFASRGEDRRAIIDALARVSPPVRPESEM